MAKTKTNFKQICDQIDLIIAGKAPKDAHKLLYFEYSKALSNGVTVDDVKLICETALKIARSKGRTLAYLEQYFWNFFSYLPMSLWLSELNYEGEIKSRDIAKDEKIIGAEFQKVCTEILSLKKEKTGRYSTRVVGVIKILAILLTEYKMLEVKSKILELIDSDDINVQLQALKALEEYYECSDDESDDELYSQLDDELDDELYDELIEKLDDIAHNTTDKSVFITCMQIQINDGVIDEMTALMRLDDWKERRFPELYGDDDEGADNDDILQ